MISSTIITLNQKAVSFLRNGHDFEAASSLLQHGINVLEHAMQDFEEDDDGQDDDMMSNNDIQTRVVLGPLAPISLSVSHQQQQNVDPFSMYANAMTAVEKPLNDSEEQDEDQDYSLLYSILCYNLGLCLHRQGLVTGLHSYLKEAGQCYEIALGTIGALDRNAFIVLLEVALLNNEGHIHNFFCEQDRVRVCMCLMQRSIQEVNNDYQWRGNLPREFKAFSKNLVLHAHSQIRPAAAA